MPITHLNKAPTRSATIWDITCDSDGEIEFNKQNPLYLHDVDLNKDEYYLGFFLVGAYQEILGMKHNLFSYPNEATIEFDEDGNYQITEIYGTQTLNDILIDLDYDIEELHRKLKTAIERRDISNEGKKELIGQLHLHLNDMVYLKKN